MSFWGPKQAGRAHETRGKSNSQQHDFWYTTLSRPLPGPCPGNVHVEEYRKGLRECGVCVVWWEVNEAMKVRRGRARGGFIDAGPSVHSRMMMMTNACRRGP